MSLKTQVGKFGMAGMRRGVLTPASVMKLAAAADVIMSRQKSPAGKFLRQNQLKNIRAALEPKARRAWISVFFPTEILHPFGIRPLSLEVLAGIFSTAGLSKEFLAGADALGVSNTMCSFHRLLIGLGRSGYFAAPDVVASTSLFCDGNLKSFSEVAQMTKKPFLYLDIPYEYTETGVAYLKEQLDAAARKVAELVNVKYSIDLIRASVAKAQEGLVRLKKIYNLRRERPQNMFRGYEMVSFCFPSHYLLGSDLLINIADRIIKGLESGTEEHKYFARYVAQDFSPANIGRTKVLRYMSRFMWMHIVPQYDTPLWDLLDNGLTARMVCEEYTKPYFEGYDLKDPYGSIAKRLILHPSNGKMERRVQNALTIAREFDVDGVIHYSSWGCHQATGNVQMLERAFESAGFKFLNLNGDAVDESNTTFDQHRTRIEAFMERK